MIGSTTSENTSQRENVNVDTIHIGNSTGGDYKRTFKSGLSSAVIKCNYFQNTFRVPWSGKDLKNGQKYCGDHKGKNFMYTSRSIVC